MAGKLIVIEGTDGSGKGTQSELLYQKLKAEGKKVKLIEFPQYGSPSAKMVEEYLNGKLGTIDEVSPHAASLFYAIDRYAKSKDIKELLTQGTIVICNRYTSANQGHQTAKLKEDQNKDEFIDWIKQTEYDVLGIPKPDLILLLYMPCEIGQKLVEKKGHRDYVGGEKKDIHEADLTHLKKAEEAFLYVAKKENWEIITCSQENKPLPIKTIQEKINKVLTSYEV